jgi:hypothetical protein
MSSRLAEPTPLVLELSAGERLWAPPVLQALSAIARRTSPLARVIARRRPTCAARRRAALGRQPCVQRLLAACWYPLGAVPELAKRQLASRSGRAAWLARFALGAAWSLRGAAWSLRGRPFEEADQVADGVVTVARVAKRKLVVDFVVVAASVAGFRQIAGSLEVGDDLCRGSFRDADGGGDVPEPCSGVGGDAFQHVRVVGHEPPKMLGVSGS